ncbi:hypothetical protein AVEN_93844-1 [Araneus ventricosus]|uniref:Uncharacterized protein n=1 Tax=Araneus ventricosus TaxID=182803 RepID=A0A4Y2AXM3_ARAVE|nr:hypothetical protein AVEN_93844-1 [Araneus ventricosus]
MDDWAVALILIGVSVLVAAGLVGMCRMLGGWTYLFAFVTGNKEERTQLASHEELGSNGYIIRSKWPKSSKNKDLKELVPIHEFRSQASAIVKALYETRSMDWS